MDDGEISNGNFPPQNPTCGSNNPPVLKRKRNLPGNPDPEAEVIALSPKTLMATNRFVCEICLKGFQRDQNLQLHRRGHNLPWKLKQRTSKEVRKRVYVCPEKTCVHHHPSRALGDLTGIKKHFCRKHGEKKWKCEKCSKRYAVQSDWKAHSKTCGTREYKCDCGTIFSRRDSFITHRAFCDALAEETARVNANINNPLGSNVGYSVMQNSLGPNMGTNFSSIFKPISSTDETISNIQTTRGLSLWMAQASQAHETMVNTNLHEIHQLGRNPLVSCSNPPPPPSNYQLNWVFGNKLSSNGSQELTSTTSLPLVNINVKDNTNQLISVPSLYSSQHQSHQTTSANMSATALLQKAAQIGTTSTDPSFLGSLGLKCNSPSQDGNKFCGIYGSNSLLTSHGSEPENYSGDLSQMPPTKRWQMQNEENAWGQTRDFLGVGVRQTICHPSSINEWILFDHVLKCQVLISWLFIFLNERKKCDNK
ncbi:LOW QUALITY PROTEIN: zinc finger protein NUTCRACKER [Gastrolobium bilobum]|uniref:LOW QUALITY PROTEIN: zinc finger protein NUTCRACKER n=1 Tax=Gastrolobium bilobum TaxID=150636 RepID=UPI002AB121D8|nr:LOW QUALITY PROTEIN: zinc finger protein NUTCRACKER [Gastrolobium bilobum]